MEIKLLNKIPILLTLMMSINAISQMKMADIEGKEIIVNSKTEKQNLIKIFDDSNYTIFYVLDRRDFHLIKGNGTSSPGNIIFFSKKYNKGILAVFRQMIYHSKRNIYNISFTTLSAENYMFIPSMIILDKDFNYEYLMRYTYIHLPYDQTIYRSSISIQDKKDRCNLIHIDLKGNAIYENIDDILSNISKVPKNNNSQKDCSPVIYDMDLRDFFPKQIIP
ncbi:hypothetical protein [Chryseobacterium aureum]|uniref:hypothetical protein n=1 Tax=Chryseobacterium aureum TaxID=2497456 RepID=UPI000F875E2D|nr:hypothetical protein [Chryseobacterium aureum]